MSETPQETLRLMLAERSNFGPGFPCMVNLSAERAEAIRAVLAENKRLASMCCVCEGDCCNGKRKVEAERDALRAEVERLENLMDCAFPARAALRGLAPAEDTEDVADAERTRALWESRTDTVSGSDKGFVKVVMNAPAEQPKEKP